MQDINKAKKEIAAQVMAKFKQGLSPEERVALENTVIPKEAIEPLKAQIKQDLEASQEANDALLREMVTARLESSTVSLKDRMMSLVEQWKQGNRVLLFGLDQRLKQAAEEQKQAIVEVGERLSMQFALKNPAAWLLAQETRQALTPNTPTEAPKPYPEEEQVYLTGVLFQEVDGDWICRHLYKTHKLDTRTAFDPKWKAAKKPGQFHHVFIATEHEPFADTDERTLEHLLSRDDIIWADTIDYRAWQVLSGDEPQS